LQLRKVKDEKIVTVSLLHKTITPIDSTMLLPCKKEKNLLTSGKQNASSPSSQLALAKTYGVGDTIAYNGNTLVWSSAVTVSADCVRRNYITQSMNYICVRKLVLRHKFNIASKADFL
jgi:hypothetical protein